MCLAHCFFCFAISAYSANILKQIYTHKGNQMTLRYIEVFLALARTPNMRDVAHKMFVSQAAISSALREFESEIGVEVFDRVGRGIRLNEKGRLLEKRLAPLHHQLDNVLALLSNEELFGKLFVGASVTLANWVMPQILYDMKVRYPNVELDCFSANSSEIVQQVESGQLDMGFVEGDVDAIDLVITPLGREELVVVTRDQELASKPRSIEDLMQYFWLLREAGSGTRETFMRHITPLGLRPKQFLELAHTDAIKHVLHNPGTLSCLPPRVIEQELAEGILSTIEVSNIRFDRMFYRIERKESVPTPLREALFQELQSHLV